MLSVAPKQKDCSTVITDMTQQIVYTGTGSTTAELKAWQAFLTFLTSLPPGSGRRAGDAGDLHGAAGRASSRRSECQRESNAGVLRLALLLVRRTTRSASAGVAADGGARRGSVTTNSVPAASDEVTSTRPPCASTISRTM